MAIIHNLLTANSYRVTADSGLQIDPSTAIATRRRSVVFRGTLKQLFQTFRFGEQVEEPESLETRLFCTGPQGVRQIDGTGGNPFWECDVEHIGLHSYVNGSGNTLFRITPLWSVRETSFPQSYADDAIAAFAAALPAGANAATSQVTIHDHVPGAQIRGVMFDATPPHPRHAQFAVMKTRLNLMIPNTVITANAIDYSNNQFSGYNWSRDMPAGATNSGPGVGVWLYADITSERIIEPADATVGLGGPKIYQFTMNARWLPRKLPV